MAPSLWFPGLTYRLFTIHIPFIYRFRTIREWKINGGSMENEW
ncbi:hypothetical protein [Flavihumibacter sp. UBA7668]|nr:hypothetical protein [Flavihumibacter sp. UBA7668]